MIVFVGVRVQALELLSIVVALFTKVKIVAVLTHVAILKNLRFAVEAFVPFVVCHLGLYYGL